MTEEKQVTYKMFLPESMRARFKSICALKQVSMNEVLVELVENWIKESESKSDRDKGAA
ncbi:plasmid partition protein ParG [Nostoc commune]|uniref:plasmid partition protein ParG n=1 Tax=Nostoc commune TaxID=1178 RepID=UPI0018C77277